MSQKKLKQKFSPISPRVNPEKCNFCQLSSKTKPIELIALEINKKYLMTDIEASYSCKFEGFTEGKAKSFPGGISEFKKRYECVSALEKYYSLS